MRSPASMTAPTRRGAGRRHAAADETIEWLRRINDYLPGGEGAIDADATNNPVTVAVRWVDGDDPNDPAVFETVAEL